MILLGKPKGKKRLGRQRHGWEDNIKLEIQEVGYDMDCIDLAQDRDSWNAVVKAAMDLPVP